ncbi:MAG: hypothetical protein GXP06_14820 [Alphaproteobacteria bacterium]|nr:hypothetical protein [Alphaproteobacteria bacterium]
MANKPPLRMIFAATGLIVAAGAAVAQVSLPPAVEATPISKDAFSTGTLDGASGALPETLWRGSDAQTLEYLLTHMPTRPATPSLGEVLKRTLLSSGTAPREAAPSLGGKKLLALARAGFAEEARTVASLSTAPRGDPWSGQAQAVADLLGGNIAAACRRSAGLTSGRDELFWVKLRVLCYAQAGERDAADLTLGVLRDRGALSEADAAFLTAATTGAAPKIPPAAQTPLQYATAKQLGIPLGSGLLEKAGGGVLAAVAVDETVNPATRIAAGERAVAMGVMAPAILSGLMANVELDIAEIGSAVIRAQELPHDPLTDAVIFQSVNTMSAPEFLRDKAKRIALGLSLADSFHRAYALSLVYADEIAALEGALLSPDEAASFALARMAVGDSVGAGGWLSAMIGVNATVAALPEEQAMAFIDLVNLLSVLDPQTATQIAGAADVALLDGGEAPPVAAGAYADPAVTARILEAAFDAALDGKKGQAALAALAASNGAAPGGQIEAVLVGQSLRTAGLGDLQRRHEFERKWASSFLTVEDAAASTEAVASHDDDGFTPRLKPRRGQ